MNTPTARASTVDVVVVGSGAAGLAAAVTAAHAGRPCTGSRGGAAAGWCERFANEAVSYMRLGTQHRIFDPVSVSWPRETPV